MLHRLIQRCGLEDCGDLIALATPEQLTGVFNLDMWRSDQPGLEEQFDADRFGVWLEVLVEAGAAVAAQKLAEIDIDLVIAALAQHLRVFDRAAILLSATAGGVDTEMIGGLDWNRSQFNRVLTKETVEGMLANLRKQVAGLSRSTPAITTTSTV
jgi:hypothetical protein